VAASLLGLAGYGLFHYVNSRKLTAVAVQYAEAEKAPPAEALGKWEKVLAERPPGNISPLAQIQIGHILGNENKWAEAGQAFLKSSEASDKNLRMVGELAWAISLENAKDFPKAMEAYRKISLQEKNPFRHEAQLGMARAHLALGQTGEAEMILYQLISTKSEAEPGVRAAALNELVGMKL
jgi:hypothetical protein